jgi:hypothetical protein
MLDEAKFRNICYVGREGFHRRTPKLNGLDEESNHIHTSSDRQLFEEQNQHVQKRHVHTTQSDPKPKTSSRLFDNLKTVY